MLTTASRTRHTTSRQRRSYSCGRWPLPLAPALDNLRGAGTASRARPAATHKKKSVRELLARAGGTQDGRL